jgi:hypothetical protein
MAKKRLIVESETGRVARETEEQREEREKKEQSTREWFLKDYARWWYALLCVAICAFGGLQIIWLDHGAVGTIAVIAFEAAAIVIEFLVYLRIWRKEEQEE